ncbi:Glycerophosphodiester phosphodiesterase domain [Dillenia turbinata]|uniref:glycerophosphodiester phosphodiesterase n=1 Tax=Dillenia turbinata TaxID=194707 RepID=A0AAN8UM71_9MAGN
MALKAVHVSDVPNLDQVPENALFASRFSKGIDVGKASLVKTPKFMVIGHRGNGMNLLQSTDPRLKALKENSILSFNAAAKFAVDYVEFDVQVTKDDCPIIFHDNFILSQDNGTIYEKRVTELSLSEFLSYGPQRESGLPGKALYRKMKNGRIVQWNVETDDYLCTLQEAFEKVDPSIGFNIELKFDDHIVYGHEHLTRDLQAILKVVSKFANGRSIIFSSFQPDAAIIVRQLQNTYPVYFLTDGGLCTFYDVRRNSLEEAMKLCLENGLQGIVSEVAALFRNPSAVSKIKESNLSLLTYGRFNNVTEAVYIQHLMGVDGVIVDLVQEITKAVTEQINHSEGDAKGMLGEGPMEVHSKPKFSEMDLKFLLSLISKLIQE